MTGPGTASWPVSRQERGQRSKSWGQGAAPKGQAVQAGSTINNLRLGSHEVGMLLEDC